MEKNLTSGSVFKNIVFFSLPYLLSYFLQTLYGMADLFIIGQFEGVDSITAVSVGSQVMHMLTVMIVGLAMGSTVVIGKAVGARKKQETASVIGNTVTLFMAVALVSTVLFLVFVDPIVAVMSTPGEAVSGTVTGIYNGSDYTCSNPGAFALDGNIGYCFKTHTRDKTPLLDKVSILFKSSDVSSKNFSEVFSPRKFFTELGHCNGMVFANGFLYVAAYDRHITPQRKQIAKINPSTGKTVETYECNPILFTVPLTEHERVSAIEGIKVIGHITKPELGCALITRDGQEFELKAQGWNPLKEK